jgi:cytochrome c biogenesis protein CcmG/thiol:disulfide interchange protein DsbE
MTRAVVPLVLFLALAGLFWFVLGKMNEGEYNPRDVPTQFIGRSAPEFALPDLLEGARIPGLSGAPRGRSDRRHELA